MAFSLKKLTLIFAFICVTFTVPLSSEAANVIPRKVIALYDTDSDIKEFDENKETLIHRFADMPLNHLGLQLDYYNIRDLDKLPILKMTKML
jgi:hypothetical protein